ncbi:MAG: MlaE family lipid ABC transporter permease subunit [Phycisphaerae bacterium]
MTNPISQLGNVTTRFIAELGRLAVFTADVFRTLFIMPSRFGDFIRELYKLGVLSLVIICVSGMAVGMVLGLQGYHTLVRFGAERSLGALVGLSLIRELGPVLAALLVTGRAASAMTAEIGTMVATEQLDGLRMLSIDPMHLVIKPRASAMFISLPLLTALFILFGIFGGYIAGVDLMGGDPGSYMSSLKTSVDFHNDILGSFIKSIAFGFLISAIASFRGYTAKPTSVGVSSATTSTVVVASVTVLLSDYVITALWGV